MFDGSTASRRSPSRSWRGCRMRSRIFAKAAAQSWSCRRRWRRGRRPVASGRSCSRRGAWRAVISLPSGAVRPYHVPVHLWVLDRPIGQGPVDPRVLLVDGATRADLGGSESTLASASWQELSDTVLTAWRSFTGDSAVDDGEAGRWRVVRAIDLLDEAVDVSPARHVAPLESGKLPSQTVEEARALHGRLRTALAALEHGLAGGDWPSGADRPSLADRQCSRNSRAATDWWKFIEERRLLHVMRTWRDRISSAPGLSYVRPTYCQGDPPSGTVPDGDVESEWVKIRSGDVIIPAVASGSFRARVATQEDHEAFLGQNLHLVRPNVALIDPWFLAGLLVTPASVQQASYGTTFMRIDARRPRRALAAAARTTTLRCCLPSPARFRQHRQANSQPC